MSFATESFTNLFSRSIFIDGVLLLYLDITMLYSCCSYHKVISNVLLYLGKVFTQPGAGQVSPGLRGAKGGG